MLNKISIRVCSFIAYFVFLFFLRFSSFPRGMCYLLIFTLPLMLFLYYTVSGATLFLSITLPNVNRFSKFFIARKRTKFPTEYILRFSPQRKYVATLPCETFQNDTICAEMFLKCFHIIIRHNQLLMLLEYLRWSGCPLSVSDSGSFTSSHSSINRELSSSSHHHHHGRHRQSAEHRHTTAECNGASDSVGMDNMLQCLPDDDGDSTEYVWQ